MSRSGSSRSGTIAVSDSTRESFTEKELMEMKERMSNEANRVVRDRYRSLLIDQQEKVDRAGEPGVPVEELKTMVCLANEEVNKVMRPREAALDAEYLKTCGQLMKATIERRQFNTTEFHPTEFSRKLMQFTQLEDETHVNLQDNTYWKRLGKAVSSIFQSTAPVESIFAGIDFEKPKKQRLQRKRTEDKVGPKVVPVALKEVTNDEERQTGELTRLYNILTKKYRENNKKPLCFFHFVVNPKSYSYTIENIFHTSFLIDMLRAEIRTDKYGLPVIIPREPEAAKQERNNCGKGNSQCLVTLSTDEFEELIKAFNIRETTIPPPPEGRKRSKSGT
ncbi:non-structural maintenance of chromosomes element 4 homolog A-like isoform X2 [Macrobrachium nipponense]|uniref:non-structural maintenance of chromosomes element 4 homolog A-like isoform X2 n=1 Tax=Macrobrachium nipponense TaxID=159736 RepID=UPI0030C8C526